MIITRLILLLVISISTLTSNTYCEGQVGSIPIDYKEINLLKSDRVTGKSDIFESNTVFCANIGELNKDINDSDFFPKEDFWKNLDRVRYEIFISDTDGKNQQRLTESGAGVLCVGPSFTYDGRSVTFMRFSKAKEGDDYTLSESNSEPLITYNLKKYPIPDKNGLRNEMTRISGYLLTEGCIVDLPNGPVRQLPLREFDRLRIERNRQTGKGPQGR